MSHLAMSESALRATAKAVNGMHPAVTIPAAYGVITALLTLGWRPPLTPGTTDLQPEPERCPICDSQDIGLQGGIWACESCSHEWRSA